MFRVNPACAWAWAWACDARRCDPTTASGLHPQGVARLAGGCSAGTSVCVERVRAGTGGPLMAVANGRAGLAVPAEADKRSCFKTARRERTWPSRGRGPGDPLRPAGEVQHSVSRLARRGLGQAPVVGRGSNSRGLGFLAAWQAGNGLRGLSQLCTLPFPRTDQRPV
jgi:hypothetical protein